MSGHFIYILECSDKSYYVGCTSDIDLRLEEHQCGRGGVYTSKRLPVQLVFKEAHPTREIALTREKQIKRWTRSKKAALIAGHTDALNRLSRCRRGRKRAALLPAPQA